MDQLEYDVFLPVEILTDIGNLEIFLELNDYDLAFIHLIYRQCCYLGCLKTIRYLDSRFKLDHLIIDITQNSIVHRNVKKYILKKYRHIRNGNVYHRENPKIYIK